MARSRAGRYYERLNDRDFSIEKKTNPGSENALPHIHDQYELLLCLSDGIQCEIDTGSQRVRCPIQKNTLLLFNNMDQHHVFPIAQDGENIRYVVYFSPAFISSLSTEQVSLLDCFLFRPFPHPQILPVSASVSLELQQQLDKILAIRDKPPQECYGQELHIRLLLAELLLIVNARYRAEHQITAVSGSRYRSVYGIISYIHECYDQELSLDGLAGRFYMNKYYLCEVFKQVTGQSPNQYVINCRLMKAKELLMGGHSVEEVCAMVGFNNMPHFSRTFKTRVGMSPKQYQKGLLGQ